MSTEFPTRPVVLYDGTCGFCKRHIARWSALASDRLEFLASQEHGHRFPEITKDQFDLAVYLVEPTGTITHGAEAVFRIAALGGKTLGRWSYEHLPGFATLSEIGYRFVASHRGLVDPIDRALTGSSREPTSHRLTISIFLRALGVIYLIAFVSLWVQIHGLVGSHGILPFAPYLESLKSYPASLRFSQLPTLCWFDCSDAALTFYCAAGTVMSVLLIVGVLPFFALVGLWVLYLSLTVAGQVFLGFQWDALLLEAGFAALFVTPFQIWMNSRTMREPSRVGLWLLRWLAFRIMFLSGVTKLIWNDASWRDGTAMLYHYWSQPLPPWTAWYMNRLPVGFQKFSVVVMYLCEVVAPVLIFTPRMPRRIAFWATLLFQTLIIATGNYGFFNILTIVVAITILDDSFWPRRLRRPPKAYVDQPWWTLLIRVPAACVILVLTSCAFAEVCRIDLDPMSRVMRFYRCAEPFRSTNWYALFRTMTQKRYEIVIEGSDDGQHWQIYDFKYKPGPVDRRPGFVAPYMPRLDWQMWFEGVSVSEGGRPSQWFVAFLQRLLEGSPQVTGLLRTNPFSDHPPRYVHALVYDYHFADDPKGRAWWKRTLLGEYVPTVQLR